MRLPLLTALIVISGFSALSTITNAQQFHPQLSSALATSHETGKPVIAIFSASGCGPCKIMFKDVYPSAQVAPYHDKFVWAYLDIDQPVNRNIMTEFKVSSIPHLAFIGSDGLPIAQVAGMKSPDELATILSVVLKQDSVKDDTIAQTNKLIRKPQIAKPTKQIISGLLKKKK